MCQQAWAARPLGTAAAPDGVLHRHALGATDAKLDAYEGLHLLLFWGADIHQHQLRRGTLLQRIQLSCGDVSHIREALPVGLKRLLNGCPTCCTV
jgi:hypothetical protein